MTATLESLSEYVKAEEISDRLNVHGNTLNNWIKNRHFPAPIRLGPSGRYRRWRREVVDEFLRKLESGE